MPNFKLEILPSLILGAGINLMVIGKAQVVEAMRPVHPVPTFSTLSTLSIAQADLTADQLPTLSQFNNVQEIKFGENINGRLGTRSLRHGGRLYDLYRFSGRNGQSIRINLSAGLANNRPTNQLQTGTLLVYPVLILLDANGNVIAQEPDIANVPRAVILTNLPATGTYHILITSRTAGVGGQYILGLQQIQSIPNPTTPQR